MKESQTYLLKSEEETKELGKTLSSLFKAGDILYLSGPLGAGKTTLVRGILEGLGHQGPVRSPTFNLIQVFPLDPPVMHADLYRLNSYEGIGIEDYLETHLCLIEWPERAIDMIPIENVWQIQIEFSSSGRILKLVKPLKLAP